VSRGDDARLLGRIAAGAGVAGAVGVIGAAGGAAFVALLKKQAASARAVIGKPFGEVALEADKTYKKSYGQRIELLMVGDSIAAGLGSTVPKGTLGARLAKGLAKRTQRAVRLTTIAVVGAETWMINEQQLPRLLPSYKPDVAVIVVGGNDVTHRIPIAESVSELHEAIEYLRGLGAHVVVGTCPDLGALRPLPQPLRSLGGRASRQLAAAQAEAALDAGAYVVNLADVVGPFFVTNPDEMFSVDKFHPSEMGYKRTAQALLPSLLHALGYSDVVPFGHSAPLAVPE